MEEVTTEGTEVVTGGGKHVPRWLDFFLGITPLPRPLEIRNAWIRAVGVLLGILGLMAILLNFRAACGVVRDDYESGIQSARFLVIVGLFILACGVSLARMKRPGLYLLHLLIAAPLASYVLSALYTPMKKGAFLGNPAHMSGPKDEVTYFLLGAPPLLPEVAWFCGIVSVYLLIFMPVVAYFTRRRLWFR